MEKTRIMKRILILLFAICVGIALASVLLILKTNTESPEDVLVEYYDYVKNEKYAAAYDLLSASSQEQYSKEAFTKRLSSIYQGIEMENLDYVILEDNKNQEVPHHVKYDSVAGCIEYDAMATFQKEDGKYKIVWDDRMIYPTLGKTDKVRIKTTDAHRGQIYDRNGYLLAGDGTAVSVGIVPGKMKDNTLKLLSEKLGISEEDIQKKLSASWVKEDYFVPIQNRKYISELTLTSLEASEDDLEEYDFQKELIEIPGVFISEITVRSYPLGEAATHLVGYVQSVTAEDLENHAGEGYTSNSLIGRSGMEGLYENTLRGRNGIKIYIVDDEGEEKEVIANIMVEDGRDVKLTIDSRLQKLLYRSFKEDPGCSVAINPYTGEVLALVSTPSYDNNKYILGMDTETWDGLNNDERKPLYNRFRSVWCPGSTFKPITGVIALDHNVLDPYEDFGSEGLSWQKDSSWGSYYITTLHDYNPVVLSNALVYSDNIYFAKTALRIGYDAFENSLNSIGFNQELPFEIVMKESVYSNEEHITREVQLADSGYGQGQVLVNPLHLASIYTAFLNDGNIVKPYLEYKENPDSCIWIKNAFSKGSSNIILDGLKQVVSNEHGTGHSAFDESMPLAGKTGTAELKASKDSDGGEIGWFAVMTTEETERPVLIVSMVEDVSKIGGSGYVVRKDKEVLDAYFSNMY